MVVGIFFVDGLIGEGVVGFVCVYIGLVVEFIGLCYWEIIVWYNEYW